MPSKSVIVWNLGGTLSYSYSSNGLATSMDTKEEQLYTVVMQQPGLEK